MDESTAEVLYANMLALFKERVPRKKGDDDWNQTGAVRYIRANLPPDEPAVGNSTLSNIKSLKPITTDTLDRLARAFGVQPWQLLCPGLGRAQRGDLSPEAHAIAKQLDDLKGDELPWRRTWALVVAHLAFVKPPASSAETLEWVASAARELQATFPHPADQRTAT